MIIWIAACVDPSIPGGVVRSCTTIAHLLRQRGHRVRELYAPRGPRNYLLFSLWVMGRLLFACNRPHWIIARSTDGACAAALARILRLKTRCALHNHGWELQVYALEKKLPRALITNHSTWRAWATRFWLLRAGLLFSDCCLCGTVDQMRWVRDHERSAGLALIPNGAPHPIEHDAGAHDQRECHFLAVGNSTWKKRITYAVDLVNATRQHVSGARLTLLGARIDNAPDWLHTPGVVGPDAIMTWYARCGFLLMPSRYEGGHPFTILEAMAAGCIVFASNIPAHRELIRPGINGFLFDGVDIERDAAQIASGVTAGSREHIRRAARQTARRHRWERQIDRLERALLS
jgi:glycosyltransferase involved in cell wall biosynthesis